MFDAASYIQPLSVPKPLTVYILPNDPRNNKTYLDANPYVQVIDFLSSQSYLTVNPPDPTIQNKFYLGTNNIAYNANPIANMPTTAGSTANLLAVNSNTSILPTTDQLTPPISTDIASIIQSSSPVFLASETNDPLANNLFSDIPMMAQPPSAVPPPTFALDVPENLYMDPTAFDLIKGTSDGIITYNANLQFDDVDMATDYNVRISVAI
jgi:hypothetical protein